MAKNNRFYDDDMDWLSFDDEEPAKEKAKKEAPDALISNRKAAYPAPGQASTRQGDKE
jgi:hypothetical protein